jgi:hypothetical protein
LNPKSRHLRILNVSPLAGSRAGVADRTHPHASQAREIDRYAQRKMGIAALLAHRLTSADGSATKKLPIVYRSAKDTPGNVLARHCGRDE